MKFSIQPSVNVNVHCVILLYIGYFYISNGVYSEKIKNINNWKYTYLNL